MAVKNESLHAGSFNYKGKMPEARRSLMHLIHTGNWIEPTFVVDEV